MNPSGTKKKDENSLDPAPGGIGIVVDVVTGDNQTNVRDKTIAALNKFYVTVPDTRGSFIPIWNNGASNDPDIALRAFAYGQGQITGDMIGSMQLDEIISHIHPPLAGANYAYKKPRGGYAGGEYGIDSAVTTGSAGGVLNHVLVTNISICLLSIKDNYDFYLYF